MSSSIEISDDDDSFIQTQELRQAEASYNQETISLSSDNEVGEMFSSASEDNIISDDEELPDAKLCSKKSAVIKNLFPTPKNQSNNNVNNWPSSKNRLRAEIVPGPSTSITNTLPEKLEVPGFEKMIGGVKVHLPVQPYGCQIALMSKVITAIQKSQNCLLESPTGSGKTLALLCGALAWQNQERDRLAQLHAQEYFSHHPELSTVDGAVDYIASPPNSKKVTPEKLFSKTVFGERSIYDKPLTDGADNNSSKRQEPLVDLTDDDSPSEGLVSIHKKRRLERSYGEAWKTSPPQPNTPEKMGSPDLPETPQNIRLPTIYYGARTHKQLEQVIKEFSRIWYCGQSKMTILSSREYSCIREFDRSQWSSKNDMCKACIKNTKKPNTPVKRGETNCKFYDNRQALNHKTLPPAFDLEDLVSAGKEIRSCPYYAARMMAQSAQIVFCPYNYLIEPGIRSSMQIDLADNIVIIDEAHNIEDICRDAATFTFIRDTIQASIKELEYTAGLRYANQDSMSYVEKLIKTLRNWDDWFTNQLVLVANKPINNKEAVHAWEVDHFIQTLNNHNIGQHHYREFSECAAMLNNKLRDEPNSLHGVTQITGTLLENLMTVLGYIFNESEKHKEDFKPVLIRTVTGGAEPLSEAKNWRNSQYNQWVEKESLSLRLMCMNPAVVFAGVMAARCVLLASGTLTPLVSLHSELAATFPLQVSPNHVIPADRVWIGSLTTCPDGRRLECNSRGTDQPGTQDGLGQAVLWVCQVTPNGVLCFLPSYMLMNKLQKRWQETGLWRQLNELKHVFMESRNVRDHNDIMDDYYKYAGTPKGALLFAVYRGKVSEGMDFKDQQARAVITVGVPYPNTFDMAVKEKMAYNDRHATKRNLLSSKEWLRVQAYRALNQAVGRCVRHRNDWGAVLLIDARFAQPYYTEHLSKWVRNFLGNNHHTYESLVNSPNSMESFMQNMVIREREE